MVMHDDTEKLVTFEDISKRNNTQIKYKLFFFHSDNLGHKCWTLWYKIFTLHYT